MIPNRYIYKCWWTLSGYQFLVSVRGDTNRETQFLKVLANHTMLTPPPTCGVSCDVYDLCRRDLENSTSWLNSRKPNSRLNGRRPKLHLSTAENPTCALTAEDPTTSFNGQNPTDVFSKSSDSQDHLLWAWRHPHSSPISSLCHIFCVISFARERKTALCPRTKRHE